MIHFTAIAFKHGVHISFKRKTSIQCVSQWPTQLNKLRKKLAHVVETIEVVEIFWHYYHPHRCPSDTLFNVKDDQARPINAKAEEGMERTGAADTVSH